MTSYTITLTPTVGMYGSDSDGNPWTTFEAVNHGYECGECGAPIERGWVRGKLFEEQLHVCSSHVTLINPEAPEMYLCQYCGQHHPISSKEWFCPLDPNRVQ